MKKLAILCLLLINVGLIKSGVITGKVNFEGKLPKKKMIKMDSDPICGDSHSSKVYNESFLIDDENNLQNVLIWIENVDYSGDTPDNTLILDQIGCVYKPRIFPVMKDQPILIKNSDATLHNIHSFSKNNDAFNIAMPKVVKKKELTFNKTEEPFRIKCDVHPWMKSWVAVFDHPYFAVSDNNGNYIIENLPIGEYTVVAFQEKFKIKGIIKKNIVIDNDGEFELDFTFKR